METLSVIVPCYNEEEAIPLFYETMKNIYKKFDKNLGLELIFVDDGSKDDTLKIVRDLSKNDNIVKYVSFSRNFGKEAAMYAGMEKSKGDYVAIMDVDLQDPPELLIDMYNSISKEGYDCVATRRSTRKGEPPLRSFFSRRFYALINKISNTEIVDGARDYRLMTRKMVDSILKLREYNRFSKGIFSWVGYKTKWIEYENIERSAGKTKFSFWSLFLYSLEGIVAFSTAPLAIASILGIIMFLISLVLILAIVLKTLIWGDPVSGYPSTMCAIIFIGGIQLFCIGILGQYLSKVCNEVKHRPIYISAEESE